MFTKKNKKVSLLHYWTIRYVATLVIGLLVIAIISVLWIHHTTLENRLNVTKFLAEEIADRTSDKEQNERHFRRDSFPGFVEDRRRFLDLESNPVIYIVNAEGIVLSTNRPPHEQKGFAFSPSFLETEKDIQKTSLFNQNFYVVKSPIEVNNTITGWVVIVQSERELTQVNQEYRLLAILLSSIAVLGWLAVYMLTRRLTEPIKNVSMAAKQIEVGSYDISLPHDPKEQEVYELVTSFKEMANRLQQLESMRTELLAGVTHELKTPVTSISGLLQAVKGDVVIGEKAKEFIGISLKETARLQKMVADLLEFNTFSTQAVPVSMNEHNLDDLLHEITYQWNIVRDHANAPATFSNEVREATVIIDPVRLQQIIINLLNNGMHAMEADGHIQITLYDKDSNTLAIDIKDDGSGIPEEEQPFIFKRFFRGEVKKLKVRGLGLGLSFSKMIAQAMNTELYLKESTPKGTTFTLELKKTGEY